MAQSYQETFAQPRTLPTAPRWTSGGGKGVLVSLLNLLATWQQRSVERHQLRAMSDHELADIALGRAEIEQEAAKPFWRA